MPVLNKRTHADLMSELEGRLDHLKMVMEARPLLHNGEGCRKGVWLRPEEHCATKGTAMAIRLAVADFKAVLAEISSLK